MFLKKTISLFILAILLQNTATAQTLFGRVVDAASNQTVEFAAVGISTIPGDSIVGGVLSKNNGYFSFSNIPDGTYLIRVQFVGFKSFKKKITVDAKKSHPDIGDIAIEKNAEILKEIEIVTEKNTMSLAIDKKIYNVGKDLSAMGGTGLDAVKNIPSVSIDADGSVTLRNGNVRIYIDGKQTTLTLDQIPADQIDRIEVMTNPSAKYDANTSGGILNIVLKKNLIPGYNGSVVAGIGTNQRYSPSVKFNLKKKPFNLSTMYSYNTESNDNKGKTTRDNFNNTAAIQHFDQTSLSDFNRIMHVGNISLDYNVNNRNTITIGGRYVNGTYRTVDDQNYISYGAADAVYSEGNRQNKNTNKFERYVSRLSYKKTFVKKGMELTADAKYSYGTSTGAYQFDTNDTLLYDSTRNIYSQTNAATGTSQLGTFQLDFTNPINDSSKLEFGIKSRYKDSENINETYNINASSSTFDSALSNNFLITEMVNAAYINYTKRIKKINIQAGLRFEQVSYTGKAENKSDETFGYTYPNNLSNIFNALFPSIYFSKKANDKHEFQINFSRKINRPRFYYLLPIVFFADKFNYRVGSPDLQPEFVNKAEINYNFVTPTFNYLTAIYGQVTENSILYVANQKVIDGNTVLVNEFENGNNSYTIGWENIARITSVKNLTISLTATPYYIYVNYVDNNGLQLQSEGLSLNSKFMVSYKFSKEFTLQLNGLYEAPKPIPQGNKTDLFFFDISLSKKIKKSFVFNLTLSDVMDTKQRGTVYETSEYYQFLIRRRASRYLKFSVTWKFGKTESKHKPNTSYNE